MKVIKYSILHLLLLVFPEGKTISASVSREIIRAKHGSGSSLQFMSSAVSCVYRLYLLKEPRFANLWLGLNWLVGPRVGQHFCSGRVADELWWQGRLAPLTAHCRAR